MWTRKNIELNNLRCFGCAIYAHTKENKLGRKCLKCIFLEYLDGVMAYKLWFIEEGKNILIVSKDVVFDDKTFILCLNRLLKTKLKKHTKKIRKMLINMFHSRRYTLKGM